MSEEQIELIKNEAERYLNGASLREIASADGVSHVTVRDNITRKLSSINSKLFYQVAEKMQENLPDGISKPEVVSRVLNAYNLLVNENKNVVEIAGLLNSTEFTIYRDLTRRLEWLKVSSPETVTEEMCDNVKKALENHRIENSGFIKKTVIDLNLLEKMYPTRSKRITFITKCALTFGLRMDSLSAIMQEDAETLREEIMITNRNLHNAILFLFDHGFMYQETAMNNFISYFNALSEAYKSKNKETKKELLAKLGDKEALDFKTKHKPGYKITEEEILALLKYQLKYGLTAIMVGKFFNINAEQYTRRVNALEDKYPELVSYYHYIGDYYTNLYMQGGRK